MKYRLNITTMAVATVFTAVCMGGEPLSWTRTPANPNPAAFSTYHGQALDLSCRFEGFGELPFAGSGVNLYWQTNGMGEAWWSMPAEVSSNTVSASWLPRHDPGAGCVTFFFGAQSNAYASAVVRLLPSPGFVPSVQPLPGVAFGLATLKDLEGKADASVTNDIEKLKTESTLVYRLFSGSNIVMEVTNYNSRVNPPAMKLMRLNDKGIYEVMWTETNGLERTYNRAASNTAEQVAALDRKAAETYAPRGWSATTSGLGADAPKDTTWISTPTTVIAGGLEYSKVVTSSGQLWFLRSNGMVANMGGNSGGYFDISASDGTSVFSIEKTDSYMAPVDADGISVRGDTVEIRLSVVSADHPFLRYAPTLNAPVAWQKEEDGFSAPIAVSWSGSSGAWVATVTTTAKEGFFQFEFFQEGGTKIKSGGAIDVSTGGILCTDGIHKCRPVYNSNGTVTLEVF